MKASVFSRLVSTSLYEKRWGPYFIAPVIAGLDKVGDEWKPIVHIRQYRLPVGPLPI